MSTSTTPDVAAKAPEKKVTSADQSEILKTIMPYAVGILVQLPLLVLYYVWLSNRSHYASWWVFALIATAGLAVLRWPNDGKQVFMESIWSNILLVLGLLSGLIGVMLVEPWFAACSVFMLIASLMARVIDRDTGKSIWTVSLPLFVSLAIPANYDVRLITWLQSTSAHLTSRILDLINLAHYMPGTVIQVPGKKYGIEEACSGIQSFFLLIFVAVVLSVWQRRTLFRSIILVIAAVFWSIFMNCIRIFAIPVFDQYAGLNLSDGIQHALLGWTTMALGILLLLSTDQFLMFLFGPVDPGQGSTGPMGKFITKIWNSLIAGKKEEEETSKRRRNRKKPLTVLSKTMAWSAAAVLALGGLWALWDIKNCYQVPKQAAVTFFSNKVVFPLSQTSMPSTVKDWKLLPDPNGFLSENRKRGSDLGQQSETWVFSSPNRFLAFASFDQAFPGWHELTTCYKNQGWKLKDQGRIRKEWEEPDSTPENKKFWPYIEAHFEKDTGEQGMLLFSLFDGFGEAYDAPENWGFVPHLMHGLKNRLGSRVRARLFRGEAYQTQVFVYGYGDISQSKRDEITDHYLEIRKIMRDQFIATKNVENGGSPEPSGDEVAKN